MGSQFIAKTESKLQFSIEEADLLLKIINEAQFSGGQVKVAAELITKVLGIHKKLVKNKLEF
ncbi:MAG: hypothetical protein Unbinned5123contig1000_6 [Prokaryotic dsDNA virus sp.]|nr:MAG: hypothetical protein Unbinned5123contig1000_6 [Prokaryotic dsDNA virus sp.]|tara:strand:- start:1257 stop:1442 length:186 start_codon:yes stop_codon:yes gene_type:complete